MSDNEAAGEKKVVPKGLQIVLFVVFLVIGIGIAYMTGTLTPKATPQPGAAAAPAPATTP